MYVEEKKEYEVDVVTRDGEDFRSEDMVRVLEGYYDLEETLLDDSMKEIQENSEVIDAGEETLNDNKAAYVGST
ncbi:hypothetical protein F2Q69_00010946 [Brassica cretica]|uniref:Uncharacterized protein n=1 Tax=Brassica cretica TaxID=69181 RepID=A0A8S9QSS7_BRACR|nr:hypothetical protein F2Q69_00010946 [Brassica cretica]